MESIKITDYKMKAIPIRRKPSKFHVYLSKADVANLRNGQQVTVKVHAGIYAFINRDQYASNCVIDDIPCLLNLFCPSEDDFEVHVNETGRRNGTFASL